MTRINLGVKPLLALLLALAVAMSITLSQAQPAKAAPTAQNHQQDFSVVKTSNKKKAKKGQTILFTLQLANNPSAGSDSGAARVTDTLGSGLQFKSVTVTKQPSATGAQNFTCTNSGNIVTCDSTRFGSNANGVSDSAAIQILAKKTKRGSVTNTATIKCNDAGCGDINPANDTSSVTVKGVKKHHRHH